MGSRGQTLKSPAHSPRELGQNSSVPGAHLTTRGAFAIWGSA